MASLLPLPLLPLLFLLNLLSLLPSPTTSTSFIFTANLSLTHATSGLRYAGANFLSPRLLSLSVPSNRVGGDDQTVYNPQTDSSNADNDFYWANGAPFHPFQPDPPKGHSFIDGMLMDTIKANSTLFLLIPLAGWVANGVPDCGSFPLADYGHQQKEWYKYGNGVYPNGTLLSGDWRCYTPYTLPDVLQWLARLRALVGGDTFERHVVLQLDNEYDIWGLVHRDVHPALVTYDELWAFTVGYGSAIKAKWPGQRIAGPVSYGWCGWWWSESDGCVTNGTDYFTHNRSYLMPWLLTQLDAYHAATGVQLLDVIDLHYYPNLPDDDLTPAHRAEYFGEVRSWYDPHYSDPSWIGQCGARCQGPALTVIPRVHAWVARYAPHLNLELAFSEYAFGFNDSSATGALATCESLAVLGAYNVTWGMRWVSPAPGSLTEEVWRLWFDYDRQGSTLHGEFAATDSSAAPNVTAYTTYDRQAGTVRVLLFSHMERHIVCAAGGDSSVLVLPQAATTSTQGVTYELVPGRWAVSRGAAVRVSAGGEGNVVVADAACGMAWRSVRLIVVEEVKVTSQARAEWRPWEGPEYEGLGSAHPFEGLGEEDMQRLREHEQEKLTKVRDGKRRMREAHLGGKAARVRVQQPPVHQ